MTTNLVTKANLLHPLILYNRNLRRAEEHSSKVAHTTVAHTLEDLISRSDIIWTCLQDQEAVLEVFEDVLKHDVGGKLFVECSTILPDATRQLNERLRDRGAELVAMPGASPFLSRLIIQKGNSKGHSLR